MPMRWKRGPTIHVGTASDVATAGNTSDEGNTNTGREKRRSPKRIIKNPLCSQKSAQKLMQGRRERKNSSNFRSMVKNGIIVETGPFRR